MSSTSRSKELLAQIGEARAKGVRQGRMQHIVVLQSINESVAKLQTDAAANPDASGARGMDDVLTLFLEIMNARLDGKG